MPSSHANCLFFFVASIAVRLYHGSTYGAHLATSHAYQSLGWSTGHRVVDAALAVTIAAYAVAVSLTRALVEVDHTIEQILAGAILGSVCAVVNECGLRPWPSPFGWW
jgi:hypothetical protein